MYNELISYEKIKISTAHSNLMWVLKDVYANWGGQFLKLFPNMQEELLVSTLHQLTYLLSKKREKKSNNY